MKKRWVLWFLWGLVLAVAVMIFLFSAQDAEDSSKTSGGITIWLIRLTHPDYDSMKAKARNALFRQYQYYVRKAAHFSEFALLGVSLRLLFGALRIPTPIPWAWLAGTLYACSDELHQSLVDGRASMWQDVAIDSAGALAGILLTSLILWRRKRGRVEKIPDQ